MEGKEFKHSFHNHMLTLKVEQTWRGKGVKCNGCLMLISVPFYSCGDCRYFLHKVCAELPTKLDCSLHPQHPLALLERSPYPGNWYSCDSCGEIGSQFVYHCSECSFDLDMTCASATHKIKDKCHPHPLTPLQVPISFVCHICREKDKGLSYKCYSCPFWVHQNCTMQADTVEHSHHEDPYPFIELQHFFHDHPLTLLANEHKTEDANMKIECYGCRTQILGPFYSCGDCPYFLHKVCAELPRALDHPLHLQHPLTLLPRANTLNFQCSLCRETGSKVMGYTCSICEFYVDMKCASATHMIHDKCHPHPLTPSQGPIVLPCHICLVEEKSPSYRCNICPFGVHQNCTLIPNTVKHSYHDHLLKLFPSIPFEFTKVSKSCDICHSKLFMFQCIYGCVRCLFFSHVSCARSETIKSPSTSRDRNTDGQSQMFLPMKQDSTDFISQFVRNYIEGDADKDDDKIDHFNHEHPMFRIDEYTTDKTCEACAIRISAPSYGCVECDYFLHKCCSDLPEQIQHPVHPEHQLILRDRPDYIRCHCCKQFCNSFTYDCSDCRHFSLDIKCALLQGTVYHEAHKHHLSLVPVTESGMTCTACGLEPYYKYILKCNTCSFVLCFICAMMPRIIKHRYGKSEPFKLTYSPFENHDDEYICEICLKELNPKQWFYHCVYADQFAHTRCMLWVGASSNIKYGKSQMFDDRHEHKYGKSQMFDDRHEHKLTMISCTYDCTRCNECGEPMRRNMCSDIGLECIPCNFRVHLNCTNWIDG